MFSKEEIALSLGLDIFKHSTVAKHYPYKWDNLGKIMQFLLMRKAEKILQEEDQHKYRAFYLHMERELMAKKLMDKYCPGWEELELRELRNRNKELS